jgi:hypothetical protein
MNFGKRDLSTNPFDTSFTMEFVAFIFMEHFIMQLIQIDHLMIDYLFAMGDTKIGYFAYVFLYQAN